MDVHWSLQEVQDRWIKDVRNHIPSVPVVLVATKIDLRGDAQTIEEMKKQKKSPITTAEVGSGTNCTHIDLVPLFEAC